MSIVGVFLAGLLIGSVLNLVIVRVPRERRLPGWPPRCIRTGEPLALWKLIPVVGWVLQRGRASNGQRLPALSLFIELFTAVVVSLLYSTHGFSLLFFYLSIVCFVLIINGAIDWTFKVVYHILSLAPTLLVVLLSLAVPGLSLRDSLLGLLIAGAAFLVFFFLAHILFPGVGVPFGLGDVFLGVFIGAAFGLSRLVPTLSYGIFLAGTAAIPIIIARRVFGRKDVSEFMPYGAYLCLGAILSLLIRGW